MPALKPVMNKTKLANEIRGLGDGKPFKAFSDEKVSSEGYYPCGFYVGSMVAKEFVTDLKATKQAKSVKGMLTPSVKDPDRRLVVVAKGNVDALRKVFKACLKTANLKRQIVFKEEGQEEPEPSAQELAEFFEDVTATTPIIRREDDDDQDDASDDGSQTDEASTSSTSTSTTTTTTTSSTATSSAPVSTAPPQRQPPPIPQQAQTAQATTARRQRQVNQPNKNAVDDEDYLQGRLKAVGAQIQALKVTANQRKPLEATFKTLVPMSINMNPNIREECRKGLVKLQADVDGLTQELAKGRQAQVDNVDKCGGLLGKIKRPGPTFNMRGEQLLEDLVKAPNKPDPDLDRVTTAVKGYAKIVKNDKTTMAVLLTALEKLEAEALRYNEICVKQHGKTLKDEKSTRSEKYKTNQGVLAGIVEARQQAQAFSDSVAALINDAKDQFKADKDGQAGAINRTTVEALEALTKNPRVPTEYQTAVAVFAAAGRKELDKTFQQKLQAVKGPGPEHAEVLLAGLGSVGPAARDRTQKGNSDSFWLNDEKGKLAYIFKPIKGESVISGDWEEGGGVARELMATKLNGILERACGIKSRGINSEAARLTDDSFRGGTLSNDTQRTGVLIQASENDGSAVSFYADNVEGAKTTQEREAQWALLNEDDVCATALMGMTTLNLDQHAGNILMKKEGDGPNQTRVVPIDWGQSLPSPEAFLRNSKAMQTEKGMANGEFSSEDVFVAQLPMAQRKFPQKHRDAIMKIKPTDVVADMELEYAELCQQFPEMENKVKPGSFDMLRKSLKFQQQAVDELTIAEMYAVYADGFTDVVGASPDKEDLAITNAVNKAKALRLLGGKDGMRGADEQIKSQGIEPRLLTMAQKVDILNGKWDQPRWEKEHSSQLIASLGDIGTYVADSTEAAEIGKALANRFQGKDYAYLQLLDKYKRMGGDPMLKKLMKGNEKTYYEVEVKRPLKEKAVIKEGTLWTEAQQVHSMDGGYERIFKAIGNEWKGKPLTDQRSAFSKATRG